MAWLSGWDKRIKCTIYNTKIDSALTWFPVTVFLTSTQGEEVFVELTSDANRFKIAFTKADGETELYGEIEKWDDANESAIIHISRDGWEITSNVDTDFYMYYDVDHADNTDYMGDIDTVAGGNVYDGNFKAVHHLVDATTSTIKDSTSNNNDGTKKAANTPLETAGKIGNAQAFTKASGHYITLPASNAILNGDSVTLETWFKTDTNHPTYGVGAMEGRIVNFFRGATAITAIALYLAEGIVATCYHTGSVFAHLTHSVSYYNSVWHHLAVVHDATHYRLYYEGVEVASVEATFGDWGSFAAYLGGLSSTARFFEGSVDEIHTSNTNRAAAWIKATYNSGMDTLLAYGSEEVGETSLINGYFMQDGAKEEKFGYYMNSIEEFGYYMNSLV